MKKQMKRMTAVLISAAMVLQNTIIPASGAARNTDEYRGPGLYRDGILLSDGDTIGEDSALEWKTEITFSEQTEDIEIPLGLIYDSKSRSALELEGPNGKMRAKVTFSSDKMILTVENPDYEPEEKPLTDVNQLPGADANQPQDGLVNPDEGKASDGEDNSGNSQEDGSAKEDVEGQDASDNGEAGGGQDAGTESGGSGQETGGDHSAEAGEEAGNGNGGSGDTGNSDGGSEDAGKGDGGSGGTGSGNGGSGDTGSGSGGSGDTGSGDTGSGNAGSGDTGNGNTGSANTGSGNTESGDTGTGSTGNGDSGNGAGSDRSQTACISVHERVLLTDSLEKVATSSQADKVSVNDSKTDKTESDGNWEWDYILTVPCRIDMGESDAEGSVYIDGLRLSVVRNGTDLTSLKFESALYKVKDGEPGDKITDQSVISQNDPLVLVLTRQDVLDEDIVVGTKYSVALPDQLKPANEGSKDMKVEFGKIKYTFATLSWETGGKLLTVEFKEFGPVNVDGGEISLCNLNNVELDYTCGLNKNSLSADEKGVVTFDLPGGKTVSFKVSELVPKPPQLNKKGEWDINSNGSIIWTVEYIHPVALYTGDRPSKLKDILPQGLDYVTDSGAVTVTKTDGTTSSPAFEYDGDRTITYDTSGLTDGEKVNITYKTSLSNETLSSIWAAPGGSYGYTNTVEALKDDDALDPQCIASDEVSVLSDWSGRYMLNKNGILVKPESESDEWSIDWTLKVNTVSRGFEELYVIDEMGKGLTLDGEITVNGTEHTSVISPDSANGKTKLQIDLITNHSPQLAEETYTIKYKTVINQEYFNQTGSDSFTKEDISNNASLYYTWPKGMGPESPVMPPTITKEPGDIGINNDLVQKSAITYDFPNHAITWKVTVNPNNVKLTKIHLTDVLEDPSRNQGFRHTFVPGATEEEILSNQTTCLETIKNSITKADPAVAIESLNLSSSAAPADGTEALDQLDIRIGNIGKKSFSFELTSYVDDPEFWASNKQETFRNTVTMKADGTEVDTVPIHNDKSATADITPVSTVLEKSHISYSPKTKEQIWQITMNKDKVQLGDVQIKDTLPEGLTCTDENMEAATFDSAPIAGTEGINFQLSPDRRTITIDVKNVTDTHMIQFPVTVDVNNIVFRESKAADILNKASLTSTANPDHPVEVVSKAVLENQMIDKSAKVKAQSGTVDYTAVINPLGINLLEGMPADTTLYIKDSLDPGLYLDLETISLYKAKSSDEIKADSDGHYKVKLERGEKVNLDEKDVIYNAKENSFSIPLEDTSAGYIMTYTAYITRTGVELSNKIGLIGSVIPENSNNSGDKAAFTMSSSGSAGFSLPPAKFRSLQIKKTDASGNILKGAEFGLYTDQRDDALLVSAPCDSASGICTLAVPNSQIKNVEWLYWKEITAPEGYGLNDQWNKVKVNNMPSDAILFTNLPETDTTSGTIAIQKESGELSPDGSKIYLPGAVFRLYMDEAGNTPAGDPVTTQEDGTAKFTGLYPGRTYWLKEESAPDGYVLQKELIAVIAVKEDLSVIPVANELAKATLTFQKMDKKTRLPLRGVRIQLFYDQQCRIPASPVLETDEAGICVCTGLQPKTTYYIKELTPAAGYELDETVYSAYTQSNVETPVTVPVMESEMEAEKDDPPVNNDPPGTSVDHGSSGSSGSSGSHGSAVGSSAVKTDLSAYGPGAETAAEIPVVAPAADPSTYPQVPQVDDGNVMNSAEMPSLPKTGVQDDAMIWNGILCMAFIVLTGIKYIWRKKE